MTVNKSFTILEPQFSHGDGDKGAVRLKQTNALGDKCLASCLAPGAPRGHSGLHLSEALSVLAGAFKPYSEMAAAQFSVPVRKYRLR